MRNKVFSVLILLISVFSNARGQEYCSETTEINICFDATHTYVSDLGFFLIGPQECGSPIVNLSPPPRDVNPAAGCCCNNGDNVDSLCFSSTVNSILDVCEFAAPLTGSFSGYASVGDTFQINWSELYGCPIESGSWRAQIFDCVGADTGSLTSAYLDITGLTDNYSYPISSIYSSINDNSCTHETASIVQFGNDIITSSATIAELTLFDFNYNSFDNSVLFEIGDKPDLNFELVDLSGRIIMKGQIPDSSPIKLPRLGSLGMLTILDSKGHRMQTLKLVLPK